MRDGRRPGKATARAVVSIALGALLCALSMPVAAERIKDLAAIAGVRDNPLVGYGLVVGLDGTGDRVHGNTHCAGHQQSGECQRHLEP